MCRQARRRVRRGPPPSGRAGVPEAPPLARETSNSTRARECSSMVSCSQISTGAGGDHQEEQERTLCVPHAHLLLQALHNLTVAEPHGGKRRRALSLAAPARTSRGRCVLARSHPLRWLPAVIRVCGMWRVESCKHLSRSYLLQAYAIHLGGLLDVNQPAATINNNKITKRPSPTHRNFAEAHWPSS